MAGHVKKPKTKEPLKVVAVEEFDSEVGLDNNQEDTMNSDCHTIAISPKKDGKHELLKIQVDSVNKTAKVEEVLDTADDMSEAIEKFKILVVKERVI